MYLKFLRQDLRLMQRAYEILRRKMGEKKFAHDNRRRYSIIRSARVVYFMIAV
jgi:hypothetical protein